LWLNIEPVTGKLLMNPSNTELSLFSPIANPSTVELSLFSGDLIQTPDTFMLDNEPPPSPFTRQLFFEGEVPPGSIMPFEEPDNDNDTGGRGPRNTHNSPRNNNIIIVKDRQKNKQFGNYLSQYKAEFQDKKKKQTATLYKDY
jgi:hypothetical protein